MARLRSLISAPGRNIIKRLKDGFELNVMNVHPTPGVVQRYFPITSGLTTNEVEV